jgi:hypothetical protein
MVLWWSWIWCGRSVIAPGQHQWKRIRPAVESSDLEPDVARYTYAQAQTHDHQGYGAVKNVVYEDSEKMGSGRVTADWQEQVGRRWR